MVWARRHEAMARLRARADALTLALAATAHFTGTLQQPEVLKTSQPFNDETKVVLLHAERQFKGDVEGFAVAEYVR